MYLKKKRLIKCSIINEACRFYSTCTSFIECMSVFLTSKYLLRNTHIQTKCQCDDNNVPDSLMIYTEY